MRNNKQIKNYDGCQMQKDPGMNVEECVMNPKNIIGLNSWCLLMVSAYGYNAIPCILHYMCTVFRDIIFSHTRRFPILNISGPMCSGKSAMALDLMRMFPVHGVIYSLQGEVSSKKYIDIIEKITNAYVLLEEYDNKQKKHIGALKNIYDGLGYTLKNGNMKQINAGVILMGREMPVCEQALFTRCINVKLSNLGINTSAYNNLRKIDNVTLVNITSELSSERDLVQRLFPEQYEITISHFSEKMGGYNIHPSLLVNSSILLAMFILLGGHNDTQFLPYRKVEDYMLANTFRMQKIID